MDGTLGAGVLCVLGVVSCELFVLYFFEERGFWVRLRELSGMVV